MIGYIHNDKDEQDKQTYLDMTAALYSETGEKRANLQYTIPLGGREGGKVNAEDYDRSELRRGTWYQIKGNITSLGGVIEATVAVADWEPVGVEADLESPYHLWVEKTLIDNLKAGEEATIALKTDAPWLEVRSPSMNGIDYFVCTLNKDEAGNYTSLTVKVNPLLAPNYEVDEDYRYITIRMGKLGAYDEIELLSKRIYIGEVNTSPYFKVTPPQYTIYISEIGNVLKYPETFTYETNMTDVKVTCGGSDVLTNGITWNENSNVTIADSGLKEDGTVTVTLDKPYDPSRYTKTQTITIDYVATDNRDTSLREEEQTTRHHHPQRTDLPPALSPGD